MKAFFTLLLVGLVLTVQAQDITGIWRGYFNEVAYSRIPGNRKVQVVKDRYKFEVQLTQNNNTFTGVTYSYNSTIFYGKATAKGTVNKANGKVRLEEIKIVELKMAGPSDACIMTLYLQYSRSGDEEFLEGNYSGMNINDSSQCGKGTVFLRRVVNSDFYKEPFLVQREKELAEKKNILPPPTNAVVKTDPKPKPPATKPPATKPSPKPGQQAVVKNTPTTPPPPSAAPKVSDVRIVKLDTAKKNIGKGLPVPTPRVLTTRENEVVRTIITGDNEILIKLYDNGTIDNDTVSVYLDKKLVVSKQRLTEKPILVKFQLDDNNDYHELVMVAENLGEIPPNTSLMLVNTSTKQYEVRITSNEQKNAVVIFKFDRGK